MAQDSLLAAAEELEGLAIDRQVDAAFVALAEANPAPVPPSPTDPDLAWYEQLFNLQTKQLREIQTMNRDSLDRLLEMMDRLGLTEAYRSQVKGFDLALQTLLGQEETGDPQEPDVPDPASQ